MRLLSRSCAVSTQYWYRRIFKTIPFAILAFHRGCGRAHRSSRTEKQSRYSVVDRVNPPSVEPPVEVCVLDLRLARTDVCADPMICYAQRMAGSIKNGCAICQLPRLTLPHAWVRAGLRLWMWECALVNLEVCECRSLH
jgi:hypothetical protein